MLHGEPDAHAVFRVVLKQGSAYSRALPFRIFGIREGGEGGCPNLRAAGGCGNIHSVTEKLSDQLGVRGFTAAGAGAGELKQRLLELAALYGIYTERILHFLLSSIFEMLSFCFMLIKRLHGNRFFFCRAAVDAGTASRAVERSHLNAVFQSFQSFASGVRHLEPFRCIGCFLFIQQEGTDDCMRANVGAHIALEAFAAVPHRNLQGDAALFIFGSALRHGTVRQVDESTDRDVVSGHGVDRNLNLSDPIRQRRIDLCRLYLNISPCGRNFHFANLLNAAVNGRIVHVDDPFTLFSVGLENSGFHIFYSFVNRENAGDLEERCLKNGIGTAAEAELFTDAGCINSIEADLFYCCVMLEGIRQILLESFSLPVAGNENAAAFSYIFKDIITVKIGFVVAGNEIRMIDQISGEDRLVAETEMAAGYAAGFLSVILEVGLYMHICMVADDLNGVFVGTDCTVRAETPELAADRAFRNSVDFRSDRQRVMRNIIIDADSIVVHRLVSLHIVILCDYLCGRIIFCAQTEAGSQNGNISSALLYNRSNILIKRFACSAGFLCTVAYGDGFYTCRQFAEEMLCRERPIKVHIQEADLFSFCRQVIHRFTDAAGRGSHGDHDTFGFRITVIIIKFIITACKLIDFFHVTGNDFRQRIIKAVACFTALEIGVVILAGGTEYRMLGIESVFTEFAELFPVNEFFEIIIIQAFHILDFVRSAETVKEVQERHMTFDGRKMCNRTEIHAVLHTGGGEESKTGLAACHYIRLLGVDGNGMGCNVTGCDMNNSGLQLPGNAVHGRNHQHQPL